MVTIDQDDAGTFSMLHVPRRGAIYTVEQPWNPTDKFIYGTPGASCVPAGDYELELAHSPKFEQKMWYLRGDGVYVRQTGNEIMRWGCMFHVANYPEDVQGCVGPGVTYSDRQMVEMSAVALNKLMSWLDGVGRVDLRVERG